MDDGLYCHGGLREAWARLGTDALNRQVHQAMFKTGPKALILGETGPLWYRGFAQGAEPEVCPELEKTLAAVGAKRMFIGHTTQENGQVNTRCGGRVVLIDTGISAHYGTHVSAVDVRAGDARAIYPTNTADVPEP